MSGVPNHVEADLSSKENLHSGRGWRRVFGFVPVVGREMRVSARKKGTYWARCVFGLVMAGATLSAIQFLSPLMPESMLGGYLFRMLAWSGMAGCLIAGFDTADRISAERREGTLGLLFLTDLRGIDVVLGKLAAAAVPYGYVVLGCVPVLSVLFLLGGVRPEEVARASLLCLNSLSFSAAAGLTISSISLSARKAVGGSVLFILAILLLPYLPDALGASTAVVRFSACLSPANAAVYASAGGWGGTVDYWVSMGVSLSYTIVLLGIAGRQTARTWRQREPKPWECWWRQLVSPPVLRSLRQRWLDISPLYWILQRRRQRWVHPSILLLTMGLVMGLSVAAYGRILLSSDVFLPWAFILNTALKIWVVVLALSLFASQHRTEELELLLTTALSSDRIIYGAIRWLRMYFGWVLLFAVLVQLGLVIVSEYLIVAQRGLPRWSSESSWLLFNALLLIPDCWALAWVGIWMGVRRPSPAHAFNGALLRLVYLPYGASLLAAWLGPESSAQPVFLGVSLIADLSFGLLARDSLQWQLRVCASEPRSKRPRS